jgi:hypothetical protein
MNMEQMTSVINTSNLQDVAKNINTKRDEILSLYKNSITKILNESKDAISISGINFDDFLSKFGKTFEALDSRLGELSEVLVNQIIPNYDELNMSIKEVFNKQFADEMNNILKNL